MKSLEEEKKSLEEQLLIEIWDEAVVTDDWTKITKVKRRTVSVKKDISVIDVQQRFPTCVKLEIDKKALEQEPEAHDLLEVSESEYLKVTEPKAN
jgi:hypothetical protein